MATTMTDDEYRAFMTGQPAHTGKLGTTRADGRPHVAPIWYDLDTDGTVIFTTGVDTVKGRTIRRDPRVCLCVDDESPPFSFVVVEGTAQISRDLDQMLVWATRIGGRYMGDDQAESYGRRNAVPEEMLVRVTPTKVVAVARIAE